MSAGSRKKILLLCPYPVGVAPGQRLKYEQYLSFLRENGFDITISSFMTIPFWRIVYKPGRFLLKVFWTIVGYGRRVWDLLRAPMFDGVYVCLWVTPFGSPLFEVLCRSVSRRLVYDIDDLIFLKPASKANPVIAYLKGAGKPRSLSSTADHVITCTPYLDSYVRQWNSRTTDISSTVDLDLYRVRRDHDNDHRLVLGWSGSHSTAPYLHLLDDVLLRLAKKIDFRLLVIGEAGFHVPGIDVESQPWELETEVVDLQRIDIGLYPLPDELWVQGKSGLKAIQYMALGIPPVATSVGANFRVIEDGVSGFLVRSPGEWEARILSLALDPGLRQSMGLAARKRVEARYSVQANRHRYLEVFNKAFR